MSLSCPNALLIFRIIKELIQNKICKNKLFLPYHIIHNSTSPVLPIPVIYWRVKPKNQKPRVEIYSLTQIFFNEN